MGRRKPHPGRCIHCLQHFENLTWDHILPKSWYSIFDKQTEKWIAPSCFECNHRLGIIEEELLVRLALCLDPLDVKTFGIPQKIQRALDPDFAKNETDKIFRRGLREKIISEIGYVSDPSREVFLPGFGIQTNVYYPVIPKISVLQADLRILFIKILRGIIYHQYGLYIEPYYTIKVEFPAEDHPGFQGTKAEQIVKIWHQFLDKNGEVYLIGKSILAKRYQIEMDPVGGLYHITIWNKFNCFLLVHPNWITGEENEYPFEQ